MTRPHPDPNPASPAAPERTTIRCASHPAAEDALDFGAFAQTMSNFASTVCVVTAARDGERLGRTVTAALSLSADPPSLVVSITTASALAALIEKVGGFSVSLLAQGQEAVGNAFAGEGPLQSRFENGQWSAWPSGQPRLDDGVASIDCRLAGSIVTGTHTLFAGILVASHTDETKSPLLWHRRGYARLS